MYSTLDNTVKFLTNYNIDKVILCGGETHSTKDYSYPMLSKVFKGDMLGYTFNKIIYAIIKIKKLNNYIDNENVKVYYMSKQSCDRILNAYWINPLEEHCIEKMDCFFNKYKFYIIKVHQCWTRFDIQSETFTSIMRYAKEHNMIIFIHLYNKLQVQEFITLANKHPENILITAHMIGMNVIITELKSTNVYFDLSAPQLYSTSTLKKAIDTFGTNRFIAGSDTPYGKNNFNIIKERLENIGLSKTEIAHICGNNIRELLNL